MKKTLSIHDVYDHNTLIAYYNQGNPATYVFFWGHTPGKKGTVGKQCLSQWYASGFEINGILYPTAEHYMMAEKARVFNDKETLEKILSARSPAEAKQLGRTVRDFSGTVWNPKRYDIVVAGNLAKFSQCPELADFLLKTGSKVLVEASPKDRIWGIGLSEDDPNAHNPNLWNGLNLLGFALMEVRKRLTGI